MARYRPPEGSASRARRLRKKLTDSGRHSWTLLRANFPDWHFRHRVPIRRFVADFPCHRAKLVIGADGGQHGEADDRTRTQIIEAEGYRVLRFWNHDILQNSDGVSRMIADVLEATPPPPKPSPVKGEGFQRRRPSWPA